MFSRSRRFPESPRAWRKPLTATLAACFCRAAQTMCTSRAFSEAVQLARGAFARAARRLPCTMRLGTGAALRRRMADGAELARRDRRRMLCRRCAGLGPLPFCIGCPPRPRAAHQPRLAGLFLFAAAFSRGESFGIFGAAWKMNGRVAYFYEFWNKIRVAAAI